MTEWQSRQMKLRLGSDTVFNVDPIAISHAEPDPNPNPNTDRIALTLVLILTLTLTLTLTQATAGHLRLRPRMDNHDPLHSAYPCPQHKL